MYNKNLGHFLNASSYLRLLNTITFIEYSTKGYVFISRCEFMPNRIKDNEKSILAYSQNKSIVLFNQEIFRYDNIS